MITTANRPTGKAKADAPPPHSLDDERGLLACVVIDPARLAEIETVVAQADFYAPSHRALFGLIRDVHAETGTVDPVILGKRWKDDTASAGAETLINDLFAEVPSATNAGYFAKRIRELAVRRRYDALGDLIKAKVRNGENLVEIASTANYESEMLALALEGVNTQKQVKRLTSAQLDEGDFTIRYLIRDVVPIGEPGIIAAKSKALKTHFAVELGMSVATGTPFLGHFPVLESGRVGMVSGESGLGALQEMARRQARSRGMELRDVENVIWQTEVPRLPGDAKSIERFVADEGLKLLVIDPAYFLLRDVGDSLANATLIGAALEPLSHVCHKLGCSIVVVAHNRKGRASDQKRFDPPTLEEVAGAGLDQWTRFWLLLGPRKEWDGDTGSHWLWLRTGGSAGHGNLFAVDVFEGKHSDEGGRTWEPIVTTATDERKQREAEKEQTAIERQERTLGDNVCKLRIALQTYPNGETARQVRVKAKLNPPAFNDALSDLEGRGEVEACQIQKGVRVYDGIKWRDFWNRDDSNGTTELSGTNPVFSGASSTSRE